ncbi:zinc finger domain-containing protein [Hirsutella rhossiliensis]|uniref:Zinc finger domain-containing protein n=1 Tax=Hirsutella rhossiliensis TaxID=111463 RepID=A0A9P8MZP0_9HYPO|nr:zinc finger domain-containing protein [Hirsutella rhossiliensis]KAH0965423.1 zinc finger domain-containing protein [Hirsutella rhossiliensis]
MLRRFPGETRPHLKEPLVKSVSGGAGGCSRGVVPGAAVVSSGRTSGYQRGQVCEVPAYVSGEENGTGKATREWFVEELPPPLDDEDAWIRGGIGVEGDSGAAVVDVETNSLVGQLWGRNKYWGPGPRLTFFTPAADIFDDIQEKCGQQTRPQLPQHRDDWDRYPEYPTCRRCYDLGNYLDSRRSSRASLQSMFMCAEDVDHDLTSVEAASELATPRSIHRGIGVEEVGASFHSIPSPIDARLGPRTPVMSSMNGVLKRLYPQSLELDDALDAPSPYPQSLELDGALDAPPTFGESSTKRVLPRFDFGFPSLVEEQPSKRPRTGW